MYYLIRSKDNGNYRIIRSNPENIIKKSVEILAANANRKVLDRILKKEPVVRVSPLKKQNYYTRTNAVKRKLFEDKPIPLKEYEIINDKEASTLKISENSYDTDNIQLNEKPVTSEKIQKTCDLDNNQINGEPNTSNSFENHCVTEDNQDSEEPTSERSEGLQKACDLDKNPFNKEPTTSTISQSSSNKHIVSDQPQTRKSVKYATKKNACLFCKQLFSKITPHLERKHKDEKEVKRFIVLPKGSDERKKIIETLRRFGNFNYNKCTDERNRITCRRIKNQTENKTEFIPCGNCKGYFSKNSLRKHVRLCHGKKDRKKNILVLSRRLEYNCIEGACERLKNEIIPVFRSQELAGLIRNDPFLISYGNSLCAKYRTSSHFDELIRTRLRTLAKLFIEIKNSITNINTFTDIFQPVYYSTIVKCLEKLARINVKTGTYGAPSTAFNLGIWLKQSIRLFIAECIEKEEEEKKRKAEDLLKLMTQMFTTTVNKTVAETQSQMQRKKKIILPHTDDIKKLIIFLTNKRQASYKKLKKGFSAVEWKQLASYTLISLQVFNRRRAGEIERLLIENFENRQKISEKDDPELYNKLDDNSKKALGQYVRCVTRGKLNRDVPVLMNSELEEYIKYILENRDKAGVPETNKYVFGMPSDRSPYLRACKLLYDYAELCGADNPKALRGTQLRKHIATQSVTYDLQENQIEYLADHMGHDKEIHKRIYRIPILTRDIAFVSQILRRAQGDSDNDPTTTTQKTAESDVEEVPNLINELHTDTNILEQDSLNCNVNENVENDNYSGTSVLDENIETTTEVTNEKRYGLRRGNKISYDITDDEEFSGTDDNWTPIKPKKRNEDLTNESSGSEEENGLTFTPKKQLLKQTCAKYIHREVVPTYTDCIDMIKNKESLNNMSPQKIRTLVASEIKNSKGIVVTEPISKPKWSTPEKGKVWQIFGDNIRTKCYPTMSQYRAALQDPLLKNRTVPKLRSFIQYQIKRLKKD